MTKFYKGKVGNYLLASLLLILMLENTQAQSRPKYRSIDGSGNNLSNPQWGAAKIPLFRELPAAYSDGKNSLAGANRPNPRAVSNRISNEIEDKHNNRGMAGLFYIWGQFIDHDITSTPTGTEKSPISLPSDEKKFSSPISFTRSAIFPGTGVTSPREQQNDNTNFIDGSMVYGSDEATARWLRVGTGGKLWVSKGNLLPYNTYTKEADGYIDPSAPKMDDDQGGTKKTFVAGDHRAAEHPGLTSLHTLFVREHNKICDRLISKGYYDDETIYQIARKEIGALIQNITYGQWLTAMGIQLGSYTGYKSNVRPDIMNTFAAAAYRWHTMVENDIIFRDNECHGVGPSELPLKDIFFNIEIVKKYDIGTILKGLSIHRQYETDLQVNSGLRNFLFGTLGTDLVSINIQRGRDHGLPSYNTVRQFYTGTKAYTFYDIAGSSMTTTSSYDPSIVSKLVAEEMRSLYGNVDNVDLWVGLFAEPHLPGKSVGRTLDVIIRSQFEKLRDGDYYFFMNDPELAADRARIQSTKLSDIISRNSSAGNFQDNVFFRKSCSSSGDDIAKWPCNVTPQYDGWTYLGRSGSKLYYRWNGGTANYEDAKRITERLGGHLPQISNVTENNTVKSFIPAGTGAWLDINRKGLLWQNTGVFDVNDVLIPGAFANYFNWKAGEPNNAGGVENRAQITSSGWNDVSGTILQTVISEVESEDNSAPSFSYCPPSVSVGMGLLTLCKPVTWPNPVATDNCGSVTITQTGGLPSGSCFWAGTSTITYTATDSKGNKSNCSFTVTGYKTFSLFLEGNESLVMDAQAEVNRTAIQFVNNTGYKNDYFTVEKVNPSTGQFEKLEVINNASKDKSVTNYISYDNSPNEGDNTYRVKVTYQDGTEKVTASKTVNFKGLTDVRVYPNPVNDVVNIDLTNYKDQPVEIYLYNYLGQQLLVEKVENAGKSAVEMNVAPFQAGNYMIRVKSKGKRDVTKSLIIAH